MGNVTPSISDVITRLDIEIAVANQDRKESLAISKNDYCIGYDTGYLTALILAKNIMLGKEWWF